MRDQPVLTFGSAAGAGAALSVLLVQAGLDADAAGRWGALACAAATFGLAVWSLFAARARVTPVADPVDNAGQPLLPAVVAYTQGNTGPA